MEDARNKLSAPETGIKSRDWIRGVVQVLGLALTLGFGMHAQAQINGADIRTIVRISTNVGDFSIGLYDEATPETVANFLWYVNEGHYNQTYIHRTENVTAGDFQVVQGGGFRFQPFFGTIEIPTQGPVRNEPVFSNVRGTIAMAKFSGEPDSATNQWYFNLSDNSESLDTNSGGFTVFGEVLGGEAGMEVLDAIMGLQKVDFGPRASFAPIVTEAYDGRPDEEFVFINMEVVDQFSTAVNVFAAASQVLISSVDVDSGAEAYSLNFSIYNATTIEANLDSVLKLVNAPQSSATYDTGTGVLFFPQIELGTGSSTFICSDAEFTLESVNPVRFTLAAVGDC